MMVLLYHEILPIYFASMFYSILTNGNYAAGWTACHAAASSGEVKMLKFLLRNGADINIKDRGGNLPIHEAARNGHVHCLKELADAGANLEDVRLSQTKGSAVRTMITEATRKAAKSKGGKEGDENLEEGEDSRSPVGYARTQQKSNALFGPRRTPISCKIKKQILQRKRQDKEKAEKDEGNAREQGGVGGLEGTDESEALAVHSKTQDEHERETASPSEKMCVSQRRDSSEQDSAEVSVEEGVEQESDFMGVRELFRELESGSSCSVDDGEHETSECAGGTESSGRVRVAHLKEQNGAERGDEYIEHGRDRVLIRGAHSPRHDNTTPESYLDTVRAVKRDTKLSRGARRAKAKKLKEEKVRAGVGRGGGEKEEGKKGWLDSSDDGSVCE